MATEYHPPALGHGGGDECRALHVLILVTEEQEINEEKRLRATAANAAFDFLQNPVEDIYTLDSRSFRPHEDVSDSTIAS